MNRDRLTTFTTMVIMAGALLGAPAISLAQEGRAPTRTLKRKLAVPAITEGTLAADAPGAIARRWGVEIASMRVASGGYMLEFRYRIVDAAKAQPLFSRKVAPVLRDEATGLQTLVPNPPTTGALRNTYDAKAGRTYFMFFANPGQLVKAGSKVTVTIGEFVVTGIPVSDDSSPSAGQERP